LAKDKTLDYMFWFAGKLVRDNKIELNCDDTGLLYGATVFTTVRIYRQSLKHPLTNWHKHYDRLSQTIKKYEWQQPDRERIELGLEKLIAHFPVLRVAIFADGRELIIGRNLPINLFAQQREGVTAWLAKDKLYRRSLAEYKTGNYLGAILALQQAKKQGARESILIDDRQNWLETSTGNLWGWRDNCWWTPRAGNILSGIARSHLIEYLQQQNILVKENDWTLDFVVGLEAIAYSNCVVEIMPIQIVTNWQDSNSSETLYGDVPQYSQQSAQHPQLIALRAAFKD
jgi:4-amino-4-deoxychorismate lyase